MLNYIIWNVNPEIIAGFHVRWYGLFFGIGFFLSYWCLRKIFVNEKLTTNDADTLTFTTFFLLLIGLRLGHCLFYEPEVYLAPYLHPIITCADGTRHIDWSGMFRIFKVWEGGLASHGGAIGLVIAFLWFAKKSGKSFMWVMSRSAVVIPITAFFVRMGNLMNSEIYGVATNLPWGVIFVRDAMMQTNGADISTIMAQAGLVSADAVQTLQSFLSHCLPTTSVFSFESLWELLLKYQFLDENQLRPFVDACVNAGILAPNHPTQIYEALTYLITGGILIAYYQLRCKHDKPISSYVILAIAFLMIFATRFCFEFIKNNQVDFEKNMTLDMGQWLSVPFIVCGLFFVVMAIRDKGKENPA